MRIYTLIAMVIAIGFYAIPIPVFADTHIITIRVVDADRREVSVPSHIVKLPPEGGERQGKTGDDGKLQLSVSCVIGTRIRAEPISISYSYSRAEYCHNRTEILLTRSSL